MIVLDFFFLLISYLQFATKFDLFAINHARKASAAIISSLNFAPCLGRLGTSVGRTKRPHIAITSNLSVWLGAGDSDLTVEPGELFGFGTGSYEAVVVRPAGMIFIHVFSSVVC